MTKNKYSKLTPWCRVLLEKLTGLQLVKEFQAFYGTRRFITALTNLRHPSLSCTSPIQSIYPHPTSWRSVLILSTHLRLGLPSEYSKTQKSLSLLSALNILHTTYRHYVAVTHNPPPTKNESCLTWLCK